MAAKRRDIVIRPEPARAPAQVMTPRVVAARAVGIGALAGLLLGVPLAGVSTIWFRPPDGFDGWWTRLSEGFTIGGFLGGLPAWALGWRIELQSGFRTLKLCLADRRRRLVMSGWCLVPALLVLMAVYALAWLVLAVGWP